MSRVRDREIEIDPHLLFGPFQKTTHLFPLHPEAVNIFRLWQVHIDNVNPLLKVVHIPSLQVRLIEAASNIINVDADLEALMFSIYCTAILSLTVEDCQTMFGSSKQYLLSKYQSGCQQALWRCGFLTSSNRDCLTALFLYLVSYFVAESEWFSKLTGIGIYQARHDSSSAIVNVGCGYSDSTTYGHSK